MKDIFSIKAVIFFLTIFFAMFNCKANCYDTTTSSELHAPLSIDTVNFSGHIICIQTRFEYKRYKKIGNALYQIIILDSTVKGVANLDLEEIQRAYCSSKAMYRLCGNYTFSDALVIVNISMEANKENVIKPINYAVDFLDDKYIYKKDRKHVYRKIEVKNVTSLRVLLSKPQKLYIEPFDQCHDMKERIPLILPQNIYKTNIVENK